RTSTRPSTGTTSRLKKTTPPPSSRSVIASATVSVYPRSPRRPSSGSTGPPSRVTPLPRTLLASATRRVLVSRRTGKRPSFGTRSQLRSRIPGRSATWAFAMPTKLESPRTTKWPSSTTPWLRPRTMPAPKTSLVSASSSVRALLRMSNLPSAISALLPSRVISLDSTTSPTLSKRAWVVRFTWKRHQCGSSAQQLTDAGRHTSVSSVCWPVLALRTVLKVTTTDCSSVPSDTVRPLL
ncbi:hypothetical protein BGZ88_006216, partial [Linnemannia elongata]